MTKSSIYLKPDSASTCLNSGWTCAPTGSLDRDSLFATRASPVPPSFSSLSFESCEDQVSVKVEEYDEDDNDHELDEVDHAVAHTRAAPYNFSNTALADLIQAVLMGWTSQRIIECATRLVESTVRCPVTPTSSSLSSDATLVIKTTPTSTSSPQEHAEVATRGEPTTRHSETRISVVDVLGNLRYVPVLDAPPRQQPVVKGHISLRSRDVERR